MTLYTNMEETQEHKSKQGKHKATKRNELTKVKYEGSVLATVCQHRLTRRGVERAGRCEGTSVTGILEEASDGL